MKVTSVVVAAQELVVSMNHAALWREEGEDGWKRNCEIEHKRVFRAQKPAPKSFGPSPEPQRSERRRIATIRTPSSGPDCGNRKGRTETVRRRDMANDFAALEGVAK